MIVFWPVMSALVQPAKQKGRRLRHASSSGDFRHTRRHFSKDLAWLKGLRSCELSHCHIWLTVLQDDTWLTVLWHAKYAIFQVNIWSSNNKIIALRFARFQQICPQMITWESDCLMYILDPNLVITVSADGPTLYGARPSADTVMTTKLDMFS